jgi:hypothetical protein
MIHSPVKRFHVVLWETEDRSTAAGFRSQFETFDEAAAVFAEHRRSERYREGILFQWLRDSEAWELIDRFSR